jgi:hypothetical protein
MDSRKYNWMWFFAGLLAITVFLVRNNESYQATTSQSSFMPVQVVHWFVPKDDMLIRCDSEPVYLGPGQSARLRWTVDQNLLKSRNLSFNLESQSDDTFDLGELSQDGPTEATYHAPQNIESEIYLQVVASVMGNSAHPAACPIHLMTRKEPSLFEDQ